MILHTEFARQTYGTGDTSFHLTRLVAPRNLEFEKCTTNTKAHDIDELKSICMARGLEQSLINDVVDEWRNLCACTRAKGGHLSF